MEGTPYTRENTVKMSVKFVLCVLGLELAYLASADLVEGHECKSLSKHGARQVFLRQDKRNRNHREKQLRYKRQ